MAELSQKTLGGAIKLLSELPPKESDTFPSVQDFWRQKLFEWGLPNWFIRYAADQRFNWTIIVPNMFSGFPRFSGTQDIVPEILDGWPGLLVMRRVPRPRFLRAGLGSRLSLSKTRDPGKYGGQTGSFLILLLAIEN
jgi:hypothetical protein